MFQEGLQFFVLKATRQYLNFTATARRPNIRQTFSVLDERGMLFFCKTFFPSKIANV